MMGAARFGATCGNDAGLVLCWGPRWGGLSRTRFSLLLVLDAPRIVISTDRS